MPVRGGKRKFGFLPAFVLVLLICYVLIYLPTPYVVYQPGSAEVIRPMIHVNEGDPEEKGTFMLTTVSLTYSNTLQYLYALVNPYQDIAKRSELLQKGESREEYSERQAYVMQTSQSNAVQAAYKKAGIPFKMVTKSVIVLETNEGMPAEKVLLPGDRLLSVDGKDVKNLEELLRLIRLKKVGETVKIGYERGKEKKEASIVLAALPVQPGEKKPAKPQPGIGIIPAELQTVMPSSGGKTVEIKAGEIGGPSAGFMFSLAILNQLTPGDLTKGYRIAGTGTITPEGEIGVIGGIKHKIVAADKEGAEIFFAPKDWYPPKGQRYQPVLNTTEAKERAKMIGTKMKIVSVGTLDEALQYLAKLPPKD
ncbi:SepM family pheromone-processing serine protease [Paenibacillus gansuensis]|uniref:endopeptidase La n=1 Tax=Paenibacillus gansuensis TaxID=306542 RepID=A0ABW5PG59_9BACL